jgi:hypothetical protein
MQVSTDPTEGGNAATEASVLAQETWNEWWSAPVSAIRGTAELGKRLSEMQVTALHEYLPSAKAQVGALHTHEQPHARSAACSYQQPRAVCCCRWMYAAGRAAAGKPRAAGTSEKDG